MRDIMQYEGYIGSVHYSDEDEVFHGKLEGVRDLVTYEGTDVASLKRAFHEAVRDYVETCKKKNKQPDTPYKGSFNVRIGTELHKKAALYAADHDKPLNSVVAEALKSYLELAER